jgi:hypothetical protein
MYLLLTYRTAGPFDDTGFNKSAATVRYSTYIVHCVYCTQTCIAHCVYGKHTNSKLGVYCTVHTLYIVFYCTYAYIIVCTVQMHT